MILLKDFNLNIDISSIKRFCENYDLRSLIKEAAYVKNSGNLRCIDLISANKPQSFIKTVVIETSLSDYHKLVTTVI